MTISIALDMEVNSNFLAKQNKNSIFQGNERNQNWKTTSFFGEMEDNHIFWQKKTTSISREMKDDLKMEDVLNFKGK